MIDFFQQQENARNRTRLLVVLFLLAVSGILVVTNLLVFVSMLLFGFTVGETSALLPPTTVLPTTVLPTTMPPTTLPSTQLLQYYLSHTLFIVTSLVVLATIGLVILFKWAQLSRGGSHVALALGARRVLPDTNDAAERKLLNVVEEMAIAAGMPVPPVFVMDNESGINAFAAGHTPADAVIGITRGAIAQLNRDQLQGVIGHEFSHILNGDMRLNLQLMAVLHGIMFIGSVGYRTIRLFSHDSHNRSYSRNNGAALMFLGVGLMITGWIGTLFGNLIKAAVNRQREFLADASAIQFTRNPAGLAGALKIIGGLDDGSSVLHPGAAETSHLFFGEAISHWASIFSTHPPLNIRIKRIDPRWNGRYPVVKPLPANLKSKQTNATRYSSSSATPPQFAKTKNQQSLQQLEKLSSHARQADSAKLLIIVLLFQSNNQTNTLQNLQQWLSQEAVEQAQAMLDEAGRLSALHQWQLVSLAIASLKSMNKEQSQTFKNQLMQLIKTDQQINLFEWALYRSVEHYLATECGDEKPSKPRYRTMQEIAEALQVVLGCMAYSGNADPQLQQRAFHKGCNVAGLYNLNMPIKEQCDIAALWRASRKLADCYPLLKPRILKSLTSCATIDKEINDDEHALLHALATIMDCPQPDLSAFTSSLA